MEGSVVKPTYELNLNDDGDLISINILDDKLSQFLHHRKDTWDFYARGVIPSERVYSMLGLQPNDDAEQKKFLAKCAEQVYPLVKELLKHFTKYAERVQKQITETNDIAFTELPIYFIKDTNVVYSARGSRVGGVVRYGSYGIDGFTRFFQVAVETICTNGSIFFEYRKSVCIPEFTGRVSVKSLPVKYATPKVMESLEKRGLLFAKYANGTHHVAYNGVLYQSTFFGILEETCRERVMIDVKSFSEANRNYGLFTTKGSSTGGTAWDPSAVEDEEQEEAEAQLQSKEIGIDKSKLWRCWPTLPVFCLQSKKWREALITNVGPIDYRKNAFDKLVLPTQTKIMLRALIQTNGHKHLFADIIAGKGNGAVILLHGPPGVGKTSSAEAVAEELQLPLYAVSVGELGINIESLEENLERILRTAARWNAVILLDEADIFLERRKEDDVTRNAMVSIFLRTMEYHQGVLFMTTNRVSTFDEAFLSRIILAIRYTVPFNQELWRQLMTEAGLDYGELMSYDFPELNGRQIRNCIRMSMALALYENRKVQKSDLANAVKMTAAFFN
jgi:DNA replication protein DnaC